jgi:hypothetical protein
MGDTNLRAVLETFDSEARDDLRRVLIHDQADCDASASDGICKLYGWPQTFVGCR